jgi:hypothetical protein
MSADLRVVALKLPSPLRAPCPSIIVVEVRNDGVDPAVPSPFDVAIDISNSIERPFVGRFFARVNHESGLAPGASVLVQVGVQFPCSSTVWVRADADVTRQIPNNAHTFLPFAVSATPALVPWLVTGLRVGLIDSLGTITWDPGILCPDKDLVVEATIGNQGCAATPMTQTAITLEDPSVGVLSSLQPTTPALVPGTSWTIQWKTQTPSGGPKTIVVRACADAMQIIVDQCSRSSLCAIVTTTQQAGSPLRLTLTIGGAGFVRPGEVPALSWRLVNDCADLGLVTVRILFGNTAIFTSQQPIGLRATAGEDLNPSQITIGPSIANAFWQFGMRTLTLEVTGTGLDSGPFRTTTSLDVRAETVDFTWFFPIPVGIFEPAWKSVYTVGFTFFNRAFATLTLTGVDCVEHPTDQNNTAMDVIRNLASGVTALGPVTPRMTMPPGIATGLFTMSQSWSWTGPPLFHQSGPTQRTFDYTLRFGMLDGFGNVYPPMTQEINTATVKVSTAKLSSQGLALGLCTAGYVLVAAGAVCAIIFPEWPAVLICVGIAATGMAMVIPGTLIGYDAMDPPVPDFNYHESAVSPHRGWELPPSESNPAIAVLNSLTQLLGRIDAAWRNAKQARDRALAAHIDGNEAARHRLRQECRSVLSLLRRAIAALPSVLSEAQAVFDERLGRWHTPDAPEAGDSLVAAARHFAEELHVPEADFAIVEEILHKASKADLTAGRQALSAGGLVSLGSLFESWLSAVEEEFAGFDFLK